MTERETTERFFQVLRENSDDKEDPIPEWEYLPYMTLHHDRCICGTKIIENNIIRHKRTQKLLVIGSDCIQRWICPRFYCEDCDAPLGQTLKRIRTKNFVCRSCRKQREEQEEEKERQKQRQIKKMDNFMLYWYGKHRNHPFKMVAEDIPYVEYLLNIPEEKATESIKAFWKYASLVFEIKEEVVDA